MNIYINAKRKTLMAIMTAFISTNLIAGPIEDAMADDTANLCADRPANELFKIADKKNNSDEDRREALALMAEVSQECNNASANRLRQYHQKMINAAYKVMEMDDIDSRQVAVECIEYVMMAPDEQQPPEGAIARGNAIANLALNDSEPRIRMWALEALATLRGDDTTVFNTLNAAINDSNSEVSETATEMLRDMF